MKKCGSQQFTIGLAMVCLAITLLAHKVGARTLLKESFCGKDGIQTQLPTDIAAFRHDSAIWVYVADTGNGRVYVADLTLDCLWAVNGENNGAGALVTPSGVAVDSTGVFYVADTGNNRIQKFQSPVGKDFASTLGHVDTFSAGLGLDAPAGMGLDLSGASERLLIADRGHQRIVVASTDGSFLQSFGSSGSEDGEFLDPRDVAVCGPNTPYPGRIFVVDSQRNDVQIFAPLDQGGSFIRAFGESGDELAQFDAPTGIDVDPFCYVHVADRGNNRVQMFSGDGSFIEVFDTAQNTPTSVAVTPTIAPALASVYVTNEIKDSVQRFEWLLYDTTGNNMPDDDGDGLPDLWETDGIDFNGDGTIDLDLPALGADPSRQDIFLEVDYMSGRKPSAGAMTDVITAFAEAPVSNPNGSTGISLHIDGPDDQVPFQQVLILQTELSGIKKDFFGTAPQRNGPNADDLIRAKALVYHYGLFANLACKATDPADPTKCIVSAKNSGFSLRGPNFVVTLGEQGTRQDHAAVMMHELGHNLGLGHGGGDNTNCKPNYLSVMNYSFSSVGVLTDTPGQGRLDYSRAELAPLNEQQLDESVGLNNGCEFRTLWSANGAQLINFGSACGPLDWSASDGISPIPIPVNLTNNPAIQKDCLDNDLTQLTGHDDWSNLEYNFRRNPGFARGATVEIELAEPITYDEIKRLKRCIETGFCERPPYEYTAKLVCGEQVDAENVALLQGRYGTSINIHNPGDDPVRLFTKLALTIPPGDETAGEIIRNDIHRLEYDEALAVTCQSLYKKLFGGNPPAPIYEGFLIIQSEASLDVRAVYTAAPRRTREGGSQVASINVINVPERKIEPKPGPDLRPQIDSIDAECGSGQSCKISLRYRVENIGEADAGPFAVRLTIGRDGAEVDSDNWDAGLAAGAHEIRLLVGGATLAALTEAGEICVAADEPANAVAETNESNNHDCQAVNMP